jgi:hypothetical protein
MITGQSSDDEAPEILDLKSSRESALKKQMEQHSARLRVDEAERERRRIQNDKLVKQSLERKTREAAAVAALLKRSIIDPKALFPSVTSKRMSIPREETDTKKTKIIKITETKSVIVLDDGFFEGHIEKLNNKVASDAIRSRQDFYNQVTLSKRTKSSASCSVPCLYRPALNR